MHIYNNYENSATAAVLLTEDVERDDCDGGLGDVVVLRPAGDVGAQVGTSNLRQQQLTGDAGAVRLLGTIGAHHAGHVLHQPGESWPRRACRRRDDRVRSCQLVLSL